MMRETSIRRVFNRTSGKDSFKPTLRNVMAKSVSEEVVKIQQSREAGKRNPR